MSNVANEIAPRTRANPVIPGSWFRLVCLCCFSLALCFSCCSDVRAEEFDVDQLQAKVYSAIDKVLPAVVAISDRGVIFSGVIVSKQGHVLSAGHAVRPNRTYTVLLADGRQFRSKGLGSNVRVDMAMLKIQTDQELPFAKLGHSTYVVTNQPCVGISHPGLFNANRGAVIRFGHILKPVTANEGMIKSTAKMEPGDSGGPLIDLDGKVIGIHSNIRRDEQSNFDVPIDSFKKYWDELREPERFYVDGYPSLPRLGFRGKPSGDLGVKVLKVYEDGQAKKIGLKPNDYVNSVGGTPVKSSKQIWNRLIELRSGGASEFFVNATRKDEKLSLRFQLNDAKQPTPSSYKELAKLPAEFAKLESKLDDDVFVVRSKVGERTLKVRATRLKKVGRGNLVSKSSRIGSDPRVELPNGTRISAKVVARDKANDLVLLSAALPGEGGLDLSNVLGDLEELRGKLLLSPNPGTSSKGEGEISVWGSKYFSVQRTKMSGGYLGVQIGYKSGNVVFDRVFTGAARKAGVKTGDALIRLDEPEVKRRSDVFGFLRTKDPNSRIKAVIKRADEELTKEILLGSRPETSGHVADDLVGGKSLRRDGFSLAISHDAELNPEDCGGPVFDLGGNLLGINIARSSRVQCYVVPKTIVKRFVDGARQ